MSDLYSATDIKPGCLIKNLNRTIIVESIIEDYVYMSDLNNPKDNDMTIGIPHLLWKLNKEPNLWKLLTTKAK